MKSGFLALLLSVIVLNMSCQVKTTADAAKTRMGMTKVTILYPNAEGKTFDMDYYAKKHMPMVAELLGDALKLYEIDEGLAGRTPDEPIPYLAIGYLYFDSMESYQNAFRPPAAQITGDIQNYTNIQPMVQISEVLQ